MRFPTIAGVAVLALAGGCRQRPASGDRPRGIAPPPAGAFVEPIIGIEVEGRDDKVVFTFKFCGGGGEPFVDRLVVAKIKPSADAGTMCEFGSDSDGSALKGSWLYGEAKHGVGRCWPLTEGTYSVVAIGSGTGETKFSLKKKWFQSGFASEMLMGGCKG